MTDLTTLSTRRPATGSRPLILASSSPRRRRLLEQAGFQFECRRPDTDETHRPNEPAADFAVRAAVEKAEAVSAHIDGPAIVLAADTIVVCDADILGKPSSPDEAVEMLNRLSGRAHQVITGYAILDRDQQKQIAAHVVTRVAFKTLTADEIKRYVASGEPMDKAGAYGIQSGAAFMVRAVYGSYTNVVGLPMCEVVEALTAEFGN